MDDEAMLWGDAMGLCYHRPIASPHRPSHRLIVHRIASSSIASPHRPSHRLIVHRIASSSIASPQRECEPSRPSYFSNELALHILVICAVTVVRVPSFYSGRGDRGQSAYGARPPLGVNFFTILFLVIPEI